MSLDLTVFVPTIEGRADLMGEAVASIEAQTLPVSFKVNYDQDRIGPGLHLNNMIRGCASEWIFRLDDDDLLDADHFEVLSHWLDDDADIVFTFCRVQGGEHEDEFQLRWQHDFGWEHLHETNFIPCAAAIRTSLFRDLGGYRDVAEEDWDLWKRALAAGARFRCVPAVTWTYRKNPEWAHRSDRIAAFAKWGKDDKGRAQ